MNSFLQKYISLANKNSPIIISKGNSICDSIFDKRLTQNDIDGMIQKINNLEDTKIKITHSSDVTTYKKGNTVIIQTNEIEYNIININDFYSSPKMYIQILDICKDQYIIPSVLDYDQVDTYDVMNICLNNNIDIQICDKQTFYTVDLIIKKPIQFSSLEPIIDAIF